MATGTEYVALTDAAYTAVSAGDATVRVRAGATMRVSIAASLPAAGANDYWLHPAHEELNLTGLDATDNVYLRADGESADARVFRWTAGPGSSTFAAALKTSANVGTANAGSTAVEYGDGTHHRTVLTVDTTLPAIAGGAALAVGKLLYTFPAGAIIVESAYMSLAIQQTEGNITADTPDGGLGTVIGAGAVATLDGTGTFEDIITGQTFNDCDGTVEVKTAIPTAGVPLAIEAGAAHTVHFNVADTWAASGDAAAGLAGTVVLNWRFVA